MEEIKRVRAITREEHIEKNPHLKDFFPLLDKLNDETPRGAVLLACSYIDELLKNIIIAFLIESKEASKLVEGFNAPLGTFSARTAMAYSLGLISEREHKEILTLKKIRNDCAHDFRITFTDQRIIDLCNNLEYSAKPPIKDAKFDSGSLLKTSAISLIMNLVNRAHYVSQKRITRSEWPY